MWNMNLFLFVPPVELESLLVCASLTCVAPVETAAPSQGWRRKRC